MKLHLIILLWAVLWLQTRMIPFIQPRNKFVRRMSSVAKSVALATGSVDEGCAKVEQLINQIRKLKVRSHFCDICFSFKENSLRQQLWNIIFQFDFFTGLELLQKAEENKCPHSMASEIEQEENISAKKPLKGSLHDTSNYRTEPLQGMDTPDHEEMRTKRAEVNLTRQGVIETENIEKLAANNPTHLQNLHIREMLNAGKLHSTNSEENLVLKESEKLPRLYSPKDDSQFYDPAKENVFFDIEKKHVFFEPKKKRELFDKDEKHAISDIGKKISLLHPEENHVIVESNKNNQGFYQRRDLSENKKRAKAELWKKWCDWQREQRRGGVACGEIRSDTFPGW